MQATIKHCHSFVSYLNTLLLTSLFASWYCKCPITTLPTFLSQGPNQCPWTKWPLGWRRKRLPVQHLSAQSALLCVASILPDLCPGCPAAPSSPTLLWVTENNVSQGIVWVFLSIFYMWSVGAVWSFSVSFQDEQLSNSIWDPEGSL